MKISETDFTSLSALVDDELPTQEKKVILQRLQTEEALQHTFVRLQQLKQSVAKIPQQPQFEKSAALKPPAQKTSLWSRSPILMPLSIAASLLMTALLLTGMFIFETGESQPQSILSWHQKLSEQSFSIENKQPFAAVKVASVGEFEVPDLRASTLFLVSEQIGVMQRKIFHYRGVNGCKLTLGVIDINHQTEPLSAVDKTQQQYHWTAGARRYQLIATAMDSHRFAAISEYLEHFSNSVNHLEQLQMAMSKSYQTAQPCS